MSHWQALTRRRPTDILWTKYIKIRDKGLCIYNFRCHKGTLGTDVSHYHGRRKESVRFDPDNSDLSCRVCHNFVHTELGMHILDEWKEKQLGELTFKHLLVRANISGHRDDYLTKIYINTLIEELKDAENPSNY